MSISQYLVRLKFENVVAANILGQVALSADCCYEGHDLVICSCKPSTSLSRKIFFANEKNMNAHEIYEKQTRQSKLCGFSIYIFDISKSKSMVRLVRAEKMVLSGLVFARKIARMTLIQNL